MIKTDIKNLSYTLVTFKFLTKFVAFLPTPISFEALWYPQMRSWSVTSAARRLALAGRSRTCIHYKLGVTVRRCQQHKAPQYLTDCVTPASDIASRQRLRAASRHQLFVPRYQLSSLGRQSFAVAGPMTWNSLSADLRDPTSFSDVLRKHSCSLSTSVSSAVDVSLRRCAI